MLNKITAKLINEQVNKEMYSAYLYLDMANYYHNEGLSGFGHWFNLQAKEEMEHAEKFVEYLHDNGEKVTLLPIGAPDKVFKKYDEPLAAALEHEKYVTSLIDNIFTEASKVKEYKTTEFLNWFVKEQVEEEKNADELVRKYQLFAKDSAGLYLLNKELGKRKGEEGKEGKKGEE